jgi:hypothetical protein
MLTFRRMRLSSTLLLALLLAPACSSASPTQQETTVDSGHGSDSGHAHDAATPTDGGGPGTMLTGTGALTFTPTFVGASTTSGSCPVCGGLPMGNPVGDGGPISVPDANDSFPSGPASFHGVVVVMSDDPGLQASCASDAAGGYDFDFQRYHYLTVQVVSTGVISPGTYAIHSALSQADGGVSYGYVDDSVPVASTGSSGIGYANEDNGTGTVKITVFGSSVQGSFDATGLERFGGGASQGNLSGSFDAPLCPGLAASAFEGPCGGCPG